VTVLTRQPREVGNGAVRVSKQRIDAGAKAEHGRGIDDVLTRRTPMDIARRLGVRLGDVGGQRLDERDRQVARFGCSFSQRGEVE
jgi:hypothetical protein